jgi:hypothetical protein
LFKKDKNQLSPQITCLSPGSCFPPNVFPVCARVLLLYRDRDTELEIRHGHREVEEETAATVSNTVAEAPFGCEREPSQNG